MTRLTPAELRAICITNPDFAARNIEALRSLLSKSQSVVTVEGERVSLSAPQNSAQTLYDLMRVHAPDLFLLFVRELPFERYWIDLAVPSAMLAVECNGGRWLPGGGKHGTEEDRRKIRRLTLAGWRVLEYSTELLANNPLGVIDEIRAALA